MGWGSTRQLRQLPRLTCLGFARMAVVVPNSVHLERRRLVNVIHMQMQTNVGHAAVRAMDGAATYVGRIGGIAIVRTVLIIADTCREFRRV